MKHLATFGAGCFWHVQLAFDNLKGIIKSEVGYMGGHTKNPKYEEVCTDKTGHVEVCQIEFDPNELSFKELLDSFWKMHDPTQVDKQGPDEEHSIDRLFFTTMTIRRKKQRRKKRISTHQKSSISQLQQR